MAATNTVALRCLCLSLRGAMACSSAAARMQLVTGASPCPKPPSAKQPRTSALTSVRLSDNHRLPPLRPFARPVAHTTASPRCTEARSRVSRGPLVRLVVREPRSPLRTSCSRPTPGGAWRPPKRTGHCPRHTAWSSLAQPAAWQWEHTLARGCGGETTRTDARALFSPPPAPPAAPAGGSERAAADEQHNVRGCQLA